VVRNGKSFEKPYLFAAIRNRYIDQHRRARLMVVEPLLEERWVEDAADLEAVHADREALEQAFANIRECEREALFLQVIEGYSAREIGELTGRSRNTVLSLLARGRKKLRQLLEASGDFQEVVS
jgi:RNA polymerase sigma-70 factor (ECF subfamily)